MNSPLLTDRIDFYRLDADRALNEKSRADLGQFMTPSVIARFMASLFSETQNDVTWLDLAHKKLDAAVCDAYGWPHDLSDEQILERLLALNLQRAGQIA